MVGAARPPVVGEALDEAFADAAAVLVEEGLDRGNLVRAGGSVDDLAHLGQSPDGGPDLPDVVFGNPLARFKVRTGQVLLESPQQPARLGLARPDTRHRLTGAVHPGRYLGGML